MWSYKDSAYVPQPQPPPGIELLYIPSTSFHISSEEAQDHIEYWGKAGQLSKINVNSLWYNKCVKNGSRRVEEDTNI